MISAETLDKAVAKGLISQTLRDQLEAMERAVALAPEARPAGDEGDEENLRLVGGGNDLFVTVGTVLLSAGFFFVLTTLLPGQTFWIAGILAVFAWGLAEIVTRQHRMKLSSSVLALIFMAAILAALALQVEASFGIRKPETIWQLLALRQTASRAGYLFLGGGIIAAAIYFWRFRVPIIAGTIAIAFTLLAFLQTAIILYDSVTTGAIAPPRLEDVPELLRAALYMPLICGLIVFATGVAFDIYDRDRRKIWSDCAFWLHVVSAPMLVHPLFIMATGQNVVFGHIAPDANATIMLTILILGFLYVALAIDRRSLLVPTLAYFGSLGIYYLVNSASDSTGIPPFALILVVVGALIILFGAGWQRIRRIVVNPTLPAAVIRRLPPLKA
ncbi:hypothetical protein EN925_21875 [Mesorhizobium sp. M7A.F.Ca.US.006.04.2.1]|uniref:hypothetical protein n=1 Tax=unclassified Mesorhizobium TaxID=325217 RepID=UPI000FCB6C2E|nr:MULTISPECIES: hypothetical protein [unclassified Mesorhizobium]RUX77741.1 hypothetical protein EN990_04975 [Mesorhizobium sp. M7A.F.Ca.US.005.03.1.1]RUY11600.1 hypothetical protein EN991_25090 [Mesorhizobium sp. M7A.F.Ca.US.005.03.2.1]RUZ99759.1 hypothetical protein EN938_27620 [Mesorhizobium sp. M7A.F.Ca.US.001.02.1.1]RVA14717.1 hypothetical protein EN932_03910 [Mesorhizobium sp. M7A.F.Ca.US.002.01.1.1]RVA87481.1 hypothetical protein EN925_21875 [Mesorhizobium sp. M7A.F.Ca.US.006.04.2.1]